MEAELNKFSFNGLASLISPGAMVLLFVLWGVAILFPHQPDYLKDYEVLAVFLFITAAYITGSFINTLASILEKKYYKAQKHDPRRQAIEGKHLWVEDLDKLYFEKIGLHIYDYNKGSNEPKPGDVNEKKMDKYNFAQFERFANFYLKKNNLNEAVETQKEKYLLFRNLAVSFFVSALLSVIYLIYSFFKPVFSIHAHDVFFNTAFVFFIIALLAVLVIVLFASAVKQRVTYLEDLYRTTRYNYLMDSSH